MGSPMDSFIGIAVQSAKGVAAPSADDYCYVQYENGNIAPNEIQRAIPRLAGSTRSLPAGFVKTGVHTGGTVDFMKCTEAIGWYLLGLMGEAAAPSDNGDGTYDHVFTFQTDEFTLPYMSVRRGVASLWYEQFTDMRVTSLVMSVPATDIVRFTAGVLGLKPQAVDAWEWSVASYLDDTDPFLSCTATITSPAFGTFIASNVIITQANAIALNEEWIVGQYYPYDLTLGARTCIIQCDIRADEEIFRKVVYDPSSVTPGVTVDWTPDILQDATFDVTVETQEDIPHTLKFEADGVENIDWAVQPVVVRAADNVQMMRLIGILRQSSQTDQIKWTLTNAISAQYA